ncbi:McrB family protein [Chryseobacterium zhengzhouense]|uniref:McrB family protein n=1 Tax=Chryseobacterium zhengzhouense TaxID=1636086 RepID=A0ABW2LYS4_9FLAO
MKISKKQIIKSSENLIETTTNKFWGLVSIFTSIKNSTKVIDSGHTFELKTKDISNKLEDLFYFGEENKKFNDNSIYLRLSKNWIEQFNDLLLKGKPNIFDCSIFYFKNYEFDSLNSVDLVNMFKDAINLPPILLEEIFDVNYSETDLELEENYNKKEILDLFKIKKNINLDYFTFSFESPFVIQSHPGELKRAPFIQTLYSGSKIQEVLLISDFNLDEYYFFNNKFKKEQSFQIFENKVLLKIIFESFKYILKKYGEEKVLKNNEIKDAIIEDRNYKGLSLKNYFGFETVIGQFDNEQTANELKSGGGKRFIDEKITILGNDNSYFTSQWNSVDNGRGLTLGNFNRLLSDVSEGVLEIIKSDSGYKLIEKSIITDQSPLVKVENVIFYGSPGTGKSHKVNEELKKLNNIFYERITFHPEYDHASFVGGYKPISEKNEEGIDEVKYKFVPQVFTNIYERAWKDQDNQYYLAIEEINRGNCAEIFGDIFQLLDRNSNYTVTPSNELKQHLENQLGADHEGIVNGLKLPNNLTIWATMNTSDQSLFPMDSAFKRRWNWEYIPICYDDIDENKSSKYIVDLGEGESFSWLKFIEAVNTKIKHNQNLGMDKCIGNYFIKPESDKIELKEFINKAIFYLWNDVFKDEDERDSIFRKGVFYEDFFPIEKGKDLILEILGTDDFSNVVINKAE